MALLTCDFFSDAIERGTSITVVLPQPTQEQIGVSSATELGPPRVLYLLHGLSDDHTAWLRYWDYVSDELPQVVDRFFRVSQAPGDTFVAGLSMGGYGALKQAMTYPERYAGVASLSGVADIRLIGERLERAEIVERVFGGTFGPEDDVFALLSSVDPATAPRLHVGCGTEEDRLMPSNERFVAEARARGLDVTTDFRPGVHEWGLWDAQIQAVFDWMVES